MEEVGIVLMELVKMLKLAVDYSTKEAEAIAAGADYEVLMNN
jgi:hypothetical protein